MNIRACAQDVFFMEIKALEKVASRLDVRFERACQAILDCSGKVVTTGVGKSGIIAHKIASTFCSTGTVAVFMHAAEASHGDFGMVGNDDILLAISYSGASQEMLAILPSLSASGIKLIAMTGNAHSLLAQSADYVLDIGIDLEACPLNLAPTCSTTAALVMGDAMAAALVTLKQFKPENFAHCHPGGTLGRRLLTKVSDVMRPYDSVPRVNGDDSMSEVVMQMTNGRMGAVCVTNERRLVGLITDGDIRRALSDPTRFFNLTAQDVMSAAPVVIAPSARAFDALLLMEQRNSQISILPVEENGELSGLVRIHDLVAV